MSSVTLVVQHGKSQYLITASCKNWVINQQHAARHFNVRVRLAMLQVRFDFDNTLKAMVVRGALLSILICCTCNAYAKAPACDAPALRSPEYARSITLVSRLPELRAWSMSHKFPVAYGESMDRQELLHGQCYWSVSVYANWTCPVCTDS